MKLKHIPGTDGHYTAHMLDRTVGAVRKAYLGGRGTGWTIEPTGYVQVGTTRVAYDTRKEAVAALEAYVFSPHKRSLVEG